MFGPMGFRPTREISIGEEAISQSPIVLIRSA